MAITDGSAVGFSNNRLRIIADRLSTLKTDLDFINDEWNSGVSALIPNNAGENFVDGAPGDARQVVTGADAWTLMGTVQGLQTTLNGGGVMLNVNKYAQNPRERDVT